MSAANAAPADAYTINGQFCRSGVSAAIEVHNLAASMRRLAADEEDNSTALMLMAERIELLSDALVAVLDGQQRLSGRAAVALGLEEEAAA